MPRYFTHYWKNETLDGYRDSGDVELEWLAANVFVAWGVGAGDVVYPLTVRGGVLYLIGRVRVKRVVRGLEVAQKHLGYKPSFRASDYLIAEEITTKHFDLEVPPEVTRELRLIGSGGIRPPVFSSPDRLDQQTFRGVRELDPDSATRLDRLLPSA